MQEVRFLGSVARESERQRQLAQLEGELREVAAELQQACDFHAERRREAQALAHALDELRRGGTAAERRRTASDAWQQTRQLLGVYSAGYERVLTLLTEAEQGARAAGERLTEAFAPLGLSEPAGRPALQAALANHQAARQEGHDLERAREAHRHSAQRSEELRTQLAVLAGELGELESEREDARHRRSAYAARLRELHAQLEQPDMARLRTRLDELRRQERARQRRHQELVSEHTASQTELRLLEGRLPELTAQEQAARAAVSAAMEALEQARAAHPRLSTEAAPDLETADGSQEVETARHSLIDAFERARPVLEVPVSYHPRLTAVGPRFLLQGGEATPDILFHHLSEELDRTRLLLNEEEARLFHDELIRELVEELDERQRQAHGWTEDIRATLRRLDFHGERLDLQSSVAAGHTHAAGRLPELIDARTAPVHQPDTWWRSVQDELRQTIRRLQQEEGAERSLSERLAQTLDYRQWLEFGFYSIRETGRHPLTDANFARRSGGERSAVLYTFLFAALAARFDRLGPQTPRLIGLDEAFAGMDLDNIGTLYRIMEALEFAWIATSERRIDTSAQLDGAATYELRTVPTPEGKLFGALGSVWDGQTTRSGTDYGLQS